MAHGREIMGCNCCGSAVGINQVDHFLLQSQQYTHVGMGCEHVYRVQVYSVKKALRKKITKMQN